MGLSYAKIADKLSKKLGEYEDILEGKPGSSTEPTEINAAKLKVPQIKQALQELEESQKVEVKVKELVDQGVPKDEARQVVIQQMQQEQMQMQQQQQQMQQQAPQGGQPQPQGMPMNQGMSPYKSGGKLPMYQGYDSRIQPGSYNPDTGKLSYRQNPIRSWDNPSEPSLADIPMNSPNVNPNTSTVPNMFMGYEQMGYAQEGGNLPMYQSSPDFIDYSDFSNPYNPYTAADSFFSVGEKGATDYGTLNPASPVGEKFWDYRGGGEAALGGSKRPIKYDEAYYTEKRKQNNPYSPLTTNTSKEEKEEKKDKSDSKESSDNWKNIAAMAPAVLGGIAALTNKTRSASANPYKDFNPYRDTPISRMNKSRTGGMDIPTAQSLGFTQSYPSLYAQKGGNLPEYQIRKDPISGADARALLSNRRTANAFHQDLLTTYGERDLASGGGYTPVEASKLGGYDNYLTAMGSLQSKNPTLNTDTSGSIEGQLPLAKQIIGDRQLNYRGLEFPSVKNMPPLTKQKGGSLPKYQKEDIEVGPGGYGTGGEYDMSPDSVKNIWDQWANTQPGPGGYGTTGEYNMLSKKDKEKWDEWAAKQVKTEESKGPNLKSLPPFQEEESSIPWGDISQGILGAVGTAPIWHNIKQSREPIDYYEGFANPYMGQMQASLGEMGRLTGEAETALKTPRFYNPRPELVAAQRRKEGAMQAASDASGGSARFALQNRANAQLANEYDQILTKTQNLNTQWNDPKAKAQGLMGLAGAYGQQGSMRYGLGQDIGTERWRVFDWAQKAEAVRRKYGTQAAMDISEWAQIQQQMGNQKAMDELSVEQLNYLLDNFKWKDGRWQPKTTKDKKQ